MESGEIKETLDVYELDGQLLRKIQESAASDVEKVINLARTIDKEIKERGGVQPFLIPIGEKAERIIEEFKARQISTEDALKETKGDQRNQRSKKREERKRNPRRSVFYLLDSEKGSVWLSRADR